MIALLIIGCVVGYLLIGAVIGGAFVRWGQPADPWLDIVMLMGLWPVVAIAGAVLAVLCPFYRLAKWVGGQETKE